MLPVDGCRSANHLTTVHIHLRLVDQHKFALRQRQPDTHAAEGFVDILNGHIGLIVHSALHRIGKGARGKQEFSIHGFAIKGDTGQAGGLSSGAISVCVGLCDAQR